MCEALEEMRKCFETHNYSPILGLVEEVQSMANRMEAALGDRRDAESYRRERSELIKQYRWLKKEVERLEGEKSRLEGKGSGSEVGYDYE